MGTRCDPLVTDLKVSVSVGLDLDQDGNVVDLSQILFLMDARTDLNGTYQQCSGEKRFKHWSGVSC